MLVKIWRLVTIMLTALSMGAAANPTPRSNPAAWVATKAPAP